MLGLYEPQSKLLKGGYMGVSQNCGYLFGGPHNKDYSILGSIVGCPYFGKLPYRGLYRRTTLGDFAGDTLGQSPL